MEDDLGEEGSMITKIEIEISDRVDGEPPEEGEGNGGAVSGGGGMDG